jgi:hypothetical protein
MKPIEEFLILTFHHWEEKKYSRGLIRIGNYILPAWVSEGGVFLLKGFFFLVLFCAGKKKKMQADFFAPSLEK